MKSQIRESTAAQRHLLSPHELGILMEPNQDLEKGPEARPGIEEGWETAVVACCKDRTNV